MATLRMRPGVLSSALSSAATTTQTYQIPGIGVWIDTQDGKTYPIPGGVVVNRSA